MHDLLTDPIFSLDTLQGVDAVSLPQLLEALGCGRAIGLPGLRRHQQEPMHVFLCQIAAMMLARTGQTDPVQSAAFWATGLRALASGAETAWTLVVDNPLQPAFMQAPVVSIPDLAAFKPKATTPDELDVLITAKNHDIKTARAWADSPELWVYALLTLQTTSGYSGRGNYGISRMNGGLGSRAIISFAPSMEWAARWRSDLGVLLSERSTLLAGPWGYRADGQGLLWCECWDRKAARTLAGLDPFFIEIARAVRLQSRSVSTGLAAFAAPTDVARLVAPDGGLVGDSWLPINTADVKKGRSVLTVSANGLTPKLLRELLFEDGFESSAMQRARPRPEGTPSYFLATVLVRGQGTTDGFHDVCLRIPAAVRRALFGRSPTRDRLAEFSKALLNDAGKFDSKVLGPALFSLYEAGRAELDFDRREVGLWVSSARDGFCTGWRERYFERLWLAAEDGADMAAIGTAWIRELVPLARATLRAAEQSAPLPAGRRLKALVNAEAMFDRCLFKHFGDVLRQPAATDHPDKEGVDVLARP